MTMTGRQQKLPGDGLSFGVQENDLDGSTNEGISSTEVATPREVNEKQEEPQKELPPRDIKGWRWGLAVAA